MKKIVTAAIFGLMAGSVYSCEGQIKEMPKSATRIVLNTIERRQEQSVIHQGEGVVKFIEKSTREVDFWYAARRATPGVVHVNATWKVSEEKGSLCF